MWQGNPEVMCGHLYSPRLFFGTLWLVGTVFVQFCSKEGREPSLAGKK